MRKSYYFYFTLHPSNKSNFPFSPLGRSSIADFCLFGWIVMCIYMRARMRVRLRMRAGQLKKEIIYWENHSAAIGHTAQLQIYSNHSTRMGIGRKSHHGLDIFRLLGPIIRRWPSVESSLCSTPVTATPSLTFPSRPYFSLTWTSSLRRLSIRMALQPPHRQSYFWSSATPACLLVSVICRIPFNILDLASNIPFHIRSA